MNVGRKAVSLLPKPVAASTGSFAIQVCAAAKADQDKDNAAVFRCLVEKASSTSGPCGQETGRAVRNAMQFYAPVSLLFWACIPSVIASLILAEPQWQAITKCRLGTIAQLESLQHNFFL